MEQYSSRSPQSDSTDQQLNVLAVSDDSATSTTISESQHGPSHSEQLDFSAATHSLLMDRSPEQRAEAARQLGMLGSPSATAYLLAALHDTSADVRRASASSLGQVGDASAIEPLKDLLARESSSGIPDQTISDAITAITEREERHVLPIGKPAGSDSPDSPHMFQSPQIDSPASTLSQFLPMESGELNIGVALPSIDFSREEEALKKAEYDLARRRAEARERRKAEDEKRRLAELEAIRTKAEAEATQRAEREKRLQNEIEELRKKLKPSNSNGLSKLRNRGG